VVAGIQTMMKSTYFVTYHGPGWPDLTWLSRFFLTAQGRREFFDGGNDCWGLTAEGVDGTGHLALHKGRLDVNLTILGHPTLGVMLQWRKTGRVPIETYYPKGDMTRVLQWTKDLRGYLHPVGLFLSYEGAWRAIKEFVEREAALPSCVEWIRDKDLPKGTFPPP
jgi:hypothetical protein